MSKRELGLILVGAGSGRRMAGIDKIWACLGERPLLYWSLERLCSAASSTVLVVREGDLDRARDAVADRSTVRVVRGGEERRDSVARGLDALPKELDIVVVHDVARPFADKALLLAGTDVLDSADGAIPGIQPVDTLKSIAANERIVGTINRDTVRAVQTPQIFRSNALREAHEKSSALSVTDDAALLEGAGYTVRVFPGSPLNFKITTQADLELGRMLVAAGVIE